ncbi:mannan-binding lectin serine protease 1-like [Phycodurus eques]|uniref:mannan-binding lectin serine protease 1-like n=1 Tax=Phycodurus eques TaxID=693459 RepID=UPI002ACF0663|nr:mannan-binding lectin serine protease 1-like [Phycodurus eques]
MTDCGYFSLELKQLGFCSSPVFLQTLGPRFPNERRTLLRSEKRTAGRPSGSSSPRPSGDVFYVGSDSEAARPEEPDGCGPSPGCDLDNFKMVTSFLSATPRRSGVSPCVGGSDTNSSGCAHASGARAQRGKDARVDAPPPGLYGDRSALPPNPAASSLNCKKTSKALDSPIVRLTSQNVEKNFTHPLSCYWCLLIIDDFAHTNNRPLLACVCVLLGAAEAARAASLTEPFGSFQSPDFPASYPDDTRRRWEIRVPHGFRVRLHFSHFDLEPSDSCQYDYVRVEAGGGASPLGVFCGGDALDPEKVPGPAPLASPGNVLSVVFSSDFSNQENFSGFRAHYSAADVDECTEGVDGRDACDHLCHNYVGGFYCSCRNGYLLHRDKRTCAVECSGLVFSERIGSVSSVNFPSSYPKSSECSYFIRVAPGLKLRLHFDHTFDVEDHPEVTCPYDYVKIRAATGEFGPFCGRQSPGDIQTDTNTVAILFHSDDTGENIGWRITYTAEGWLDTHTHTLYVSLSLSAVVLLFFVVVPGVAGKNPFCLTIVLRQSLGNFRFRSEDGLETPSTSNKSSADKLPFCRFLCRFYFAETVSQCSSPAPGANATVTPLRSEYSSGDRVRVLCSPGFALIKDGERVDGEFELRCQQDGTWNATLPVCQRVDCGCPAVVGGAEVVLGNHDNGTRFGAAARYVCEERHRQIHPEHACGRPSRPLAVQVKRIVGGRAAEPGNFPWQVLLSVEDLSRVPAERWFGSGALLSDTWILTAAHVLRSRRRDARVVPVAPEHVKVLAGVVDVSDKQASAGLAVSQVLIHPDFRPSDFDNDVALVKLSVRVELNNAVRPVCLPPQSDAPTPQPHSLGVVAGWGVSHPDVTSNLLQFVRLPVVPQDECRASYAARAGGYNISDNMFCAGFYEGGRDTCLGDSGGAFVAQDPVSRQWAVLGLVSWAGPEECGSLRVYGVYTRVNKYLKWIQERLLVVI